MLSNLPPPTLTVSIVTYRPNLALLDATLRKLSYAIAAATEEGLLRAVNLVLIDNTGDRAVADAVVKLGAAHFENSAVTMNYLHGHANIGYGAAHNLVMHGGNTHYHLVLNPDVELAPDALCVALRYLAEHADVGVVVPAVSRPDGTREYLCKRYPTILDLALRGFAPGLLRRIFQKRLDRYEMRDAIGDAAVSPVPVMSGSFLLVRRKAIEVTGGFDPEFFLYFEDFDWSVRLNQVTQSAYLPDVRVVHHGGRAAGKGPRHAAYFARSAVRFFNKHGWKLA
ncbi:MAG TPA: glycosyltransferase family 2 protein [Casimicrobiaceae bacterium]|nr:glycosyltransferase family 2 protein [Casimicrobiaceae bacterium]